MKAPEKVTRGLTDEMIQHVESCPIFGWQLRHPLMIEQFLGEEVNDRWATNFKVRKQFFEKFIESKEYSKAIFMIERPFRFNEYLRHVYNIAPAELQAELLLNVWTDSEVPYVNREYWEECFRQLRSQPSLTETIKHLSFPLTVYRGFSATNGDDLTDVAMSLSWTTDRDVALKFAQMNRQASGGRYVVSTVLDDSSLLFAYSNDREEEEVILSMDVVKQELDYQEV